MTLDAALRRATKEHDGGPDAGDVWRRPFDIAARAIVLMYPHTDPDEIELSAWEFPNLPKARTLVREYLEEWELGE